MKKIQNPPNPFLSVERERLEPPGDARLEVYEDSARSILTRNDSPDLSFTWSLNPYRGCFHSCAYCYARQYHEYLGLGAGTDFESKIAVKKNAAALLRRELRRPSWDGEPITFSGATDCYQPLEAVYKLTQDCLKVCVDFKNPAVIITKGYLVTRDIPILQELHRRAFAAVVISIPFASDETAKAVEPQASTITRRFKAVGEMAKAGIPVGISLAPTIPGLNDADIPNIMKRAASEGATFAFHTMMRLPGSVAPVFEEKIRETLPPERVERILNRVREARGGKLNNSTFGKRMKGDGEYWKTVHDVFKVNQRKYKLENFPALPDPSPFQVPKNQLELF